MLQCRCNKMMKITKTASSKKLKYFRELLKEYHSSRLEFEEKEDKKSKGKLIALTLALSQYYYEHNEMEKAKHHLRDILDLKEKVENVHLYFALIALYENDNDLAVEELGKELKLFPNNSFAKNLKEKIEISITFPFISLCLLLLFLGISFFLEGTLTLTSLFTWGLNSNSITIINGLSSIFIHSSWTHVISNIVILLLFGHLLEKYIGPLKFILIFISSAVLGNLAQALFYPSTSGFVVGASAGMFGILGALLIRNPLLETKLFGLVRVPLIYILGVLFSLSILVPTSLFQSAEIAHVIGLFMGIFIAGLFYQENISIFYNWIFVAFGLLLWTLGIKELLLNPELLSIIISTLVALVGLSLALFGYELLEKSFLKKGDIQ